MLIEHRLADSGAFRDVVHRGCVVTLARKHFKGGIKKLRTPN